MANEFNLTIFPYLSYTGSLQNCFAGNYLFIHDLPTITIARKHNLRNAFHRLSILTLEVRRITSSSFPEVKSIVAVLDILELCAPFVATLWEGTASWIPFISEQFHQKMCKATVTSIC
jgi:hypothetical protein